MLKLQLSGPKISTSGVRPLFIFIFAFAVLICFPAVRTARAADLRSCTPEMLDIQVLPPLEQDSVNQLHALVIEVANHSQSSCQLQGPSVELLPQSGADTFTNSFFSDQQMSPSEQLFHDSQSLLDPGKTAHLLVVWHSLDSQMSAGCVNRDRLTLSFGLNLPPVLTVEHLWMRICDRAYVSRYRAGHYVGEPLPAEWMQRFAAQPADFVASPIVVTGDTQAPLVIVETLANREMLHDYFELFVDLPRPDFNCPFVVLHRRYADGQTTAYLNNCKIMSAQERSRLRLQDTKWTARLNLPSLGMQPEKLGTVEYDVFSAILENGSSVYVRAKTSVLIRDPEFPVLPTIDSPLPDCQAAQLQASKLPTLDGGRWHDAHVYDVTNISQETCRLGGVPPLTFSRPEGQGYTWIPSPCPNCADPLFKPRPSGWIDLEPGKSAHFMVGAIRFNTEAGRWRLNCTVVEKLELKLAGENQSISLPFGVGTCAQVNISAWRAGKYDGDPENLVYGKSSSKQPLAELSKDCATADFSSLGRPVMLEHGKMAFGLSVSPEAIAYRDPVLLHLWIDNQTAQEASVMTCMTLDFFWAEGFELYDAYGHRLLKKNEDNTRSKQEHPSSENPNKECLGGWVCSRNFPIPIPPHTCTNGGAYQPYDFTRNLADSYDLPPGVYYIVPSPKFDANMCRENVPRLGPAALADKLRFSIEQK
jgi:hypothetical protein